MAWSQTVLAPGSVTASITPRGQAPYPTDKEALLRAFVCVYVCPMSCAFRYHPLDWNLPW